MTVTDGNAPAGADERGVHKVHSAVPFAKGDPDPGVNAPARGRPREDSGESAQSQPPSAQSLHTDDDPAPVTWSDRAAGVRGLFTPPDIWSQDRPALSKVWAYATRGDWTLPTGAPRRAGQIYAVVIAVPVRATADITGWVAERPSRLAATAALLWLLTHVPPLSWLI